MNVMNELMLDCPLDTQPAMHESAIDVSLEDIILAHFASPPIEDPIDTHDYGTYMDWQMPKVLSDISLQSFVSKPHSQARQMQLQRYKVSKAKKRPSFSFDDVPPQSWTVRPLSALRVALSVNRTLDHEFALLSKYKATYLRKGCNAPTTRKRREAHDLMWRPLSIFRVYTNITPKEIESSNYHECIPLESCFGQINMRTKGAWRRSKRSEEAIGL